MHQNGRMRSLPIFVRLTGRPVILLGGGEAALAKRRLLERAGAVIVDEAADASLAIVALEEEAEPAVARLRARGILINAVDRPDLCDFTMPAIVDRDPVIVAIGTDGRSAGLAKAIRQRLELLFPAGLGGLAERLFALRPRLAARFPDPRDRRLAIDRALAWGGPLDPLGTLAATDDWVDEDAPPATTERVRITLRSPDPDQLTLAEARLLGTADRIVHHPGVPATILDRARADALRLAADADGLAEAPGLTVEIGMA